jgi:prolyl oligopeptidase
MSIKVGFKSVLPALFFCALGFDSLIKAAEDRALPVVPTPQQPATNVYHGVRVVDDYQWLEDAANPAVRDWTRAQNARTRDYFDQLDFRPALAQELNELMGDQSAVYSVGDRRGDNIFALRSKPPAQQPVLVRLKSLQHPSLRHVVFDPNAWNTNGTTSMDWWVPSTDGKTVAISLSENGSENGTLHFVDAISGQPLSDIIPDVQFPTAGGSAAWNADSTGVFYTRYPAASERPAEDRHFYQQIWFHKLGTPTSQDTYELGKDFPRVAEVGLRSSDDGTYLLAAVENGDGGDRITYLRDATGAWHQLSKYEDEIKEVSFGKDASLYLLSKRDAPRGKILRLPLTDLNLADAAVVVPQTEGVISQFEASAHGLYVAVMEGGPSRLWFYPASGSPIEVAILPVSSVSGIHCWAGDEMFFWNSSYLNPGGYYAWEPGLDRPIPTAMQMTSPANFDDIEVVREFATSKDGTKIPLNILRKKGIKLDGQNPTELTGYGGYGISQTPGFNARLRVWFDAGGVYAVANLRGGGEFGEDWHRAGNLTRKQNVFDDFIACADYLVQSKYTSPNKLAVMGGSNGGLLMGAFLTQRPELARAVVSRVGIYDMLRSELDPNGFFNTTEFGSVQKEDEFKALYAYSPYHHVTNGIAYPAVLFPCGETDGRVNPLQSRKMTARLQAATASDQPILLRTTATAGHGIGSSLSVRVAEETDIYAFLFHELGVDTSPWIFK